MVDLGLIEQNSMENDKIFHEMCIRIQENTSKFPNEWIETIKELKTLLQSTSNMYMKKSEMIQDLKENELHQNQVVLNIQSALQEMTSNFTREQDVSKELSLKCDASNELAAKLSSEKERLSNQLNQEQQENVLKVKELQDLLNEATQSVKNGEKSYSDLLDRCELQEKELRCAEVIF